MPKQARVLVVGGGVAAAHVAQALCDRKEELPETVLSRFPVIGTMKEWGHALCGDEVCIARPGTARVSMVPFGIADVIVAFDGSCHFFVVPTESAWPTHRSKGQLLQK